MGIQPWRTVRGRMLFWIIALVAPIYSGALYMSYDETAQKLEASAERDADELAAKLVAGMDATIRPIEGAIRTVAFQLEEVDPPRSQYSRRILGILKAWPDVYGSTIATEIGNDAGHTQPFAPYLFRQGSEFAFSDLASEDYVYHQLPWYRRPADSGLPAWSLPYFDAGGGNAWMVTYSVPFFRNLPEARRALAGVVTADLDLNWVRSAAARVKLGPIDMGWLSTPPASHTFVTPIGDTDERIRAFDSSLDQDAIRDFGETMLARKSTLALMPREISAKPAYLAVRNLETLGWRMMLVIPRAGLLADARALLNRQLWLGAAGLVLLILAVSVVASGITRPIRALATAVSRTDDGNLDLELPRKFRRDEIGVLTEALRRMSGSLREHIRLQAESLAEQARLGHELKIAASIQQSMLPSATTVTDLPHETRVAAALLPARQVGGDLYDYFRDHDGNLFIAIGDVSDKGIPASLFMARLSSLLRIEGAAGIPLDRLLTRINARLAEGNEACMFVTVACGLLDVRSGRLRYANAGHDAPMLKWAEGHVRPLTLGSGPAIGIEAVVDYPLEEISLAPGDTLVLFTDGVTDAEAHDGSMFGSERLQALLRRAPADDPAALVKLVVDTVAAHAPDFHATDDLTVMAVRWKPSEVEIHARGDAVTWQMKPGMSEDGVRQAQLWLRAILAARDVTRERIGEVELIAEELLTNIVRAAMQPAGATRLTMDCTLLQGEIVLTVRDDGSEFDPLARPPPDLDADIADRGIGGLGIPLVRHLAQTCSYSRTDGWNVLEVRLGRTPFPDRG